MSVRDNLEEPWGVCNTSSIISLIVRHDWQKEGRSCMYRLIRKLLQSCLQIIFLPPWIYSCRFRPIVVFLMQEMWWKKSKFIFIRIIFIWETLFRLVQNKYCLIIFWTGQKGNLYCESSGNVFPQFVPRTKRKCISISSKHSHFLLSIYLLKSLLIL